MKIVFLSRYQNSTNRGAEVFVKELSLRLSKKHNVEILSGKDADSFSKIISGNYDVVFSINGGMQSLKASLGKVIKGYKLIISGQAGIGRGEIWNIFIVKPDIYVALTDFMASWAKKWAWGTKIVKIPNGVDLSKFKPEGEKIDFNLKRPIVLSVGALVWYKHHEKAIKALSHLKEGSLLIVGEGGERKKLEKLGKNLLGENFKIISSEYEDMPKIYRSCDLFTLPSWEREAFGIAYLEAMASGLGVVAPNDKPRQEIIKNAGILVDVDNESEYSKAIDESLKKDWRKIARAQAEKYSWDDICKQYEKLFEIIKR